MMGKFVKRYVIRDAETQDEYIHLYYTIEKKVVVHADEIQKVRCENEKVLCGIRSHISDNSRSDM